MSQGEVISVNPFPACVERSQERETTADQGASGEKERQREARREREKGLKTEREREKVMERERGEERLRRGKASLFI